MPERKVDIRFLYEYSADGVLCVEPPNEERIEKEKEIVAPFVPSNKIAFSRKVWIQTKLVEVIGEPTGSTLKTNKNHLSSLRVMVETLI